MIDFDSPTIMALLYVAIFVGILLAFDGLRQLTTKTEQFSESRNRRMRLIKNGATTEDVMKLLMQGKRHDASKRGSLMENLRQLINQSGWRFGMTGYILLMVTLGMATYVLGQRFIDPGNALIGAAAFALIVPVFILKKMRTNKIEKLTSQLPDALDLMARGLKIGHPLNVTVNSVATDMPDPIGSEFGLISDQVSYGDNIVDAFIDFAERVECEDAQYLAASVGIQHGTGGNLSHVLHVLSKVIRDRATMRKRITAISAEGRLSAFILSILPLMIFGMVNFTTPSYYGDVSGDPLFMKFAIAIVTLVILQALILFKMVTFKF